jgi:Ni2+-binding GTPase involved in maturation of urease and hydrogenase
MKKRMLSAALVLFFVMGSVGSGFAAKLKCTVDSIDGEKVTMMCEKADKLKKGDKLRITPPKKGAAVEGC